MVFPGAEGEHNPDPPNTQQHEEKQDAKPCLRQFPSCRTKVFFLFFVVGVGESEVSKVCVKESFRILGG